AIFDVNGNQISDLFDYIYSSALFKEESEYYVACTGGECAVYHKDGKKVSDDFSIEDIEDAEIVKFNDVLAIAEIYDRYGNVIKRVDFNPVYPHKKEEFLDYTKLLNI
ncbi:MAG: hypothetical protein ACP5Q5_11235, partial [Brevinematia bacterium]